MFSIFIKGFTKDDYLRLDDGEIWTFPDVETAEAHVEMLKLAGWALPSDCSIVPYVSTDESSYKEAV